MERYKTNNVVVVVGVCNPKEGDDDEAQIPQQAAVSDATPERPALDEKGQ